MVKEMHNSDFNPGTPHAGIYFMCLTIVLQVISTSSPLNQVAAICTIAAALTTCALNLKRYFKK